VRIGVSPNSSGQFTQPNSLSLVSAHFATSSEVGAVRWWLLPDVAKAKMILWCWPPIAALLLRHR